LEKPEGLWENKVTNLTVSILVLRMRFPSVPWPGPDFGRTFESGRDSRRAG
jgi:hypothetical protein